MALANRHGGAITAEPAVRFTLRQRGISQELGDA